MQYLLALVVLAAAIYTISKPLLAARRDESGDGAPGVADLEAARDAKYREIHDAELDVRTGKLSDEDYADLDRTLRGEAIDILHRLDETRPPERPAQSTDARPRGSEEATIEP